MYFLRPPVFFAGMAVVAGTVLSAVRTVVLPRAAQSLITRTVFRNSARIFRLLAGEGRSYEWRDKVMALYAPITLVMLPGAWLALLALAYTAMFWAIGYGSVMSSFRAAGSSLLTLGVSALEGWSQSVLGFTAAALGLTMVALLITFLPSLYAAFSRREQQVTLLEVRAGSPPSAVEMLLRVHRIGWIDRLPQFWLQWEVWFADLEESHTSYPALAWFRSPRSDQSWVTAAGTVLDGAALCQSAVREAKSAAAALCLRAGYLALRRVAGFFGVTFDPNPQRGDQISITRAEFDEVLTQLREAGIELVDDLDTAWLDFAGWRVNYDTVLLALAELTIAPYAPWTSDRSAPDHLRPRLSRWGSVRFSPGASGLSRPR